MLSFSLMSSGFNTQPPEGGCFLVLSKNKCFPCFNTQPPEGGCVKRQALDWNLSKFQHTAARRRLRVTVQSAVIQTYVSTHSRPKAAAHQPKAALIAYPCFNTQPPEGGCSKNEPIRGSIMVSTHSRPKAAAPYIKK